MAPKTRQLIGPKTSASQIIRKRRFELLNYFFFTQNIKRFYRIAFECLHIQTTVSTV